MAANHITDRKNTVFLILCGIFISNAVLAELIGVKIFSLEATLGVPAAQIPVLEGFVLDFNLSAGALIWPVVFVTSDLINEYFGTKGVKKISYLAVGLIAYTFVVVFLTTGLSPANFWLEGNSTDAQGRPFDVNFAYTKLFSQSLSIIVASITAFLVGQLLDAYIFQALRHRTGSRLIWLRATGSTLISQLVDSFLILTLAFYVLGNWTFSQVISVGIIQYIYKMTVAVVLTPVIYVAHHWIDRYLGEKTAEQLMHQAEQQDI